MTKAISELDVITTMADTDILEITSDPDGTPLSKKITKANALKEIIAKAPKFMIKKTADETVNNSTTLQNDDHIVFTPEINKTYIYKLTLFGSCFSTSDYKYLFTVPTSCTIGGAGNSLGGTALERGLDDLTLAQLLSTNTENIILAPCGIITMSSTAGDITFQWAQDTAAVEDTETLIGTTLEVWEIA